MTQWGIPVALGLSVFAVLFAVGGANAGASVVFGVTVSTAYGLVARRRRIAKPHRSVHPSPIRPRDHSRSVGRGTHGTDGTRLSGKVPKVMVIPPSACRDPWASYG